MMINTETYNTATYTCMLHTEKRFKLNSKSVVTKKETILQRKFIQKANSTYKQAKIAICSREYTEALKSQTNARNHLKLFIGTSSDPITSTHSIL